MRKSIIPFRSCELTAATRAGAAFAAAQLKLGINYETSVAEVNAERAALFVKVFIQQEGETFYFKILIVIFWLIQSQCQPGASSATCCQVDADGSPVFICKIVFKLFLRSFGNFNHLFPPHRICLYKLRFLSVFVNRLWLTKCAA